MNSAIFPVSVRSGDWTAEIDDRGKLMHLALGPVEVLREVAGVIRDDKWGTVAPKVLFSHVAAGQHDFDVRFSTRHTAGPIDFSWGGRVTGSPDGKIRFEFSGTARTEFETNRIGLVLLHPLAWAGQACVVHHPDGTETREQFPLAVAPFQPFTEVIGFGHTLEDGRSVDIHLEGSVFETEDQRNWSDASFKTYAPPLHEPYPIVMRAGDRIRQAAVISLIPSAGRPRQPAGPAKAVGRASQVVVDMGEHNASPLLGWGFPPGAQSRDLESTVRRLEPGHVRVDLVAGEGTDVAGISDLWQADRLGVGLEVAVHLTTTPKRSLERLAGELAGLRRAPSAVIVFDADAPATTCRSMELFRTHLPWWPETTALGVGTDDNLAELLRNPVQAGALGADFVSFSINPQVHDESAASIMSTAAALGSMVATARASSGGADVAVSPLTLRPRRNIYVSGSRIDRVGRDAAASDERQKTSFAAAWLVAAYSALARAGVARLTVAELVGPRGLAATDSNGGFSPYPVFRVAMALRQATGLAACTSSDPAEVEGFAAFTSGGLVAIVANLTGGPQVAHVSGLPSGGQELVLAPYEVWIRDFVSGTAQELPYDG